jgi:hypothetical protein
VLVQKEDADAIRAGGKIAPGALMVLVGRVHPHHGWDSATRGYRPHGLRRRRSAWPPQPPTLV